MANLDVKSIPSAIEKAIVDAFKIQLSVKASVVGFSMKNDILDKHTVDCLSILAMKSSKYVGSLTLGFSESTFLNVLEKMIGERAEGITSENSDASGEMLNIIFSSARKMINEGGFDFEPSLPSTICGNNLALAKSNLAGTALFFDCDSELGQFILTLSLKEK